MRGEEMRGDEMCVEQRTEFVTGLFHLRFLTCVYTSNLSLVGTGGCK